MKSYFCITALLLFFLIGCAPEHEMQLTGTIDGLKKGTLLLQKVEDTMLVSVDSITIDRTNAGAYGSRNFDGYIAGYYGVSVLLYTLKKTKIFNIILILKNIVRF